MTVIKITDMTTGAPVDGTEVIPTSKSAAPRKITVAEIKTWIVDQLEAISPGSAVVTADKLYLLDDTDSALKPIAIETVLQHGIDIMWAKAKESSPDSADELLIKDGGSTEKTITFSVFAEYVRATVEAAILELSSLADGSGTLAVGDLMLVTQGGVGKQVTVDNIKTLIYATLAAHIDGLAGTVTAVGTDEFYFVRTSASDKMTLDELATFINASATVGGSGTTDYLAQWDNSNTLKAGPTLGETPAGFSTGLNTELPSSAAVRQEMDEIINDATAMSAAVVAADTLLIDDGANGTQRKATFTQVKTHLDTVGTYKTIYVPVVEMHPCTTNGCAALAINEYGTTTVDLKYLAFDGGATEERAQFAFPMPEDWDRGTVKVKFRWASATGSSVADTCEWGIKAGALSDDDAINTALGTAVTVSDAILVTNGTDMHTTAATGSMTVAGDPALGDMIVFEVYRNTDGTDNMAEKGWLFGVEIQYLSNEAVAAW